MPAPTVPRGFIRVASAFAGTDIYIRAASICYVWGADGESRIIATPDTDGPHFLAEPVGDVLRKIEECGR